MSQSNPGSSGKEEISPHAQRLILDEAKQFGVNLARMSQILAKTQGDDIVQRSHVNRCLGLLKHSSNRGWWRQPVGGALIGGFVAQILQQLASGQVGLIVLYAIDAVVGVFLISPKE